MPDYPPKLIAHSENIGDNSSSDYYLSFSPTSLADNNASANIVSKTIMYVLDIGLMIILLPFTACQRAYENDHLMVMLRVILEVSLELIMWLVLAGVSILTSAALIFDDLYCGKSGSEGYRLLVKNYADHDRETTQEELQHPSNVENDLLTGNELPEETVEVVRLRDTNRESISSTFPKYQVQVSHAEKTSKMTSYAPEKDDDCVNFSFYKPIDRHDFVAASELRKQER